jgi:hypothetical protein
MAAVLRVAVAAGGGWVAVRALGGSDGLFVALAAALIVYGIANAMAVARGAWFAGVKEPAAQPSCHT